MQGLLEDLSEQAAARKKKKSCTRCGTKALLLTHHNAKTTLTLTKNTTGSTPNLMMRYK